MELRIPSGELVVQTSWRKKLENCQNVQQARSKSRDKIRQI